MDSQRKGAGGDGGRATGTDHEASVALGQINTCRIEVGPLMQRLYDDSSCQDHRGLSMEISLVSIQALSVRKQDKLTPAYAANLIFVASEDLITHLLVILESEGHRILSPYSMELTEVWVN